MVVPFLIMYISNWTIFFVIIVPLLRKSCKPDVKKKQGNISLNLFVNNLSLSLYTLSILFGLGWGIATQDIHNNKIVRDLYSALFVIVTAFHGLFIFIVQCLHSNHVQSVYRINGFTQQQGRNFQNLLHLHMVNFKTID